jgi:DNA-binding GntR family transcriptional regulator
MARAYSWIAAGSSGGDVYAELKNGILMSDLEPGARIELAIS